MAPGGSVTTESFTDELGSTLAGGAGAMLATTVGTGAVTIGTGGVTTGISAAFGAGGAGGASAATGRSGGGSSDAPRFMTSATAAAATSTKASAATTPARDLPGETLLVVAACVPSRGAAVCGSMNAVPAVPAAITGWLAG